MKQSRLIYNMICLSAMSLIRLCPVRRLSFGLVAALVAVGAMMVSCAGKGVDVREFDREVYTPAYASGFDIKGRRGARERHPDGQKPLAGRRQCHDASLHSPRRRGCSVGLRRAGAPRRCGAHCRHVVDTRGYARRHRCNGPHHRCVRH